VTSVLPLPIIALNLAKMIEGDGRSRARTLENHTGFRALVQLYAPLATRRRRDSRACDTLAASVSSADISSNLDALPGANGAVATPASRVPPSLRVTWSDVDEVCDLTVCGMASILHVGSSCSSPLSSAGRTSDTACAVPGVRWIHLPSPHQ